MRLGATISYTLLRPILVPKPALGMTKCRKRNGGRSSQCNWRRQSTACSTPLHFLPFYRPRLYMRLSSETVTHLHMKHLLEQIVNCQDPPPEPLYMRTGEGHHTKRIIRVLKYLLLESQAINKFPKALAGYRWISHQGM